MAAVEGGVISALRRSHELTNGRKWPLLGVLLVWLLAALLLAVGGAFALAFAATDMLILLGGMGMLQVAIWALWGVVGATSYYHLRSSAEG